ncbi:MAG: 16S rRNA (uracil(1498)-N(3))-methyltransferase [Alphaproteobacteria bacterium]|nr:16S rRNA (uracil(1498)-N(3))-methyltransferase [Alphaproteobacteria bacterium]
MIRLFTPYSLKSDTTVSMTQNQVHYLFHVMRKKCGENVLLFNGQEGEWQATIETLSKKNGTFTLVRQTRVQDETHGDILAVALIKKDCFDFVLQKATELGVREIIPLITARTVVKQLNMERAQTILTEAAEQCERLDVPVLHEPQTLSNFLKNASCPMVYLSERGATSAPVSPDKTVCFVIGPEGGWHPDEIKQFETHPNASALNLGRLILRAETAAISILAAHRFHLFNIKPK